MCFTDAGRVCVRVCMHGAYLVQPMAKVETVAKRIFVLRWIGIMIGCCSTFVMRTLTSSSVGDAMSVMDHKLLRQRRAASASAHAALAVPLRSFVCR